MPPNTYSQNPALRPTVLIQEVMKTVYRPSTARELPARPDATDKIVEMVARETHRAA